MDVAAEAGREAVGQHLHHPAERVAVAVGGVDLGDHRRAGGGVEAAHRVVVESLDVVGLGARVLGSQRGADRDDVADQPDVQRLRQEGLGDGAERDPGRCLAGAGSLEDRPGVVESVLLHAGEVGVPRARAGQRRVAGQPLQDVLVDRVGDMTCSHLGHSVLPMRRATGPPWVSPWRTPPSSSRSSRSKDIRAPRP